jgi:antitoxin MazE
MKTQIIQIGNSQGIRIPKVLLEESGIKGEVGLELCPEGILIKNIEMPRARWDAIFRALVEVEDDEAHEQHLATEFETKEWQW